MPRTPDRTDAPAAPSARRAPQNDLWRFIGNHEARLTVLESGVADVKSEVKEARSELAAVHAHLVRQDADVAEIRSGIAALRDAAQQRGEEHKATLHAIKLAAFSTVLSAILGLAVAGLEHLLIR